MMKTKIFRISSVRGFVTEKFKLIALLFILSSTTLLVSCGGDNGEANANNEGAPSLAEEEPAAATTTDEGIGIGPVSHVDIGPSIDNALADKGKTIFEAKCTACHNPDANKKVGPGLLKVTERRKPEWIMNMILNPGTMVQEDPTAKELLATYLAPMANQSLTEDEARAVLEFFRKNDAAN